MRHLKTSSNGDKVNEERALMVVDKTSNEGTISVAKDKRV